MSSAKVDKIGISPPWQRQHLDCRPAASVEAVVSDLVGIQTTYETSPPLCLAARLPKFSAQMLSDALANKQLVWMSAMRGSKFILPAALAEHAIAAFAELAEEMTWNGLSAMGAKRSGIEKIVDKVCAVLTDSETPLTSKVIKQRVRSEDAEGAIFILAARGEIMRAGRRGQYVLRRQWMPEIKRLPTVKAAVARFVSAYLKSYGPLLTEDAIWWSGLPKRLVLEALEQSGEQRIDGYWTARDQPPDSDPPAESLRLLPALDPLTMGWLRRERIVDAADYKLVYTRHGASRPGILCGGRLVGVWDARGKIETSARFKGSRKRIRTEIERLSRLLRSKDRSNRR